MYYFPLIGTTKGNTDMERAKVPAKKKWNVEDPTFDSKAWVSQGGWLGAVYTDGEVVVDIDNKVVANRLLANLAPSGCQINTTPKGCHLIYTAGKGIKNKAKVICALGIEIDYRTSGKGYIVYPSGQDDRKIIQEGITEELPAMFYPTSKKGFDLVVSCQEGGRNSALNSWGWFLGKNKLPLDTLVSTNMMLDEPLELEEVSKILGSLSTKLASGGGSDEEKTNKTMEILETILENYDLLFDGYDYRQYNGLFWDTISIFAIEKLIYENGAKTISQMNNVRSRLRAEVLHENTAPEQKRKLNLLNGVLDIDTRELAPHDKSLYFNYVINSEFCKSDTKRITSFISNIIGEEQLCLFKKMCGKILLQNNQKCEAAFFWQGTQKGGNGKGTLLTLIDSIFSHATVRISFDSLDEKFGLTNIEGKLLLVDSDFNNTLITQTERFKKLVSGEPLELEFKGVQSRKEVRFQGTIIVLTNYLPTISVSGSGGFYRRSNLIKFMKDISDSAENDPNVKEKVLSMKVDFLNFCLEGLDLLAQDNYIVSGTKETTEEWELANDPLRVWLREEYICSPDSEVKTDDVYEEFSKWVYAYNEKKKSRSQFLKVISRVFPSVINVRVRKPEGRIFVLKGLSKRM
jgi:P4 family phage/plasmid primase-like protien